MSLLVKVMALFEDNFCYFVRIGKAVQGVLVDPADPKVVFQHVDPEAVGAVIYTHKHWDHAGQSPLLRQSLPKIPFYAGCPDNQHILAVNQPILKDTEIQVLPNLKIKFLKTPCHTIGHTCLFMTGEAKESGWREDDTFECGEALFTGDTMFLGGAGKFFEGDEKDMYQSLGKLKEVVPESSYVFPGHEYTMKNYAWARSLQDQPKDQIDSLLSSLKGKKWSIPGLLKQQKKTNPFLSAESSQRLKFLRQHKNNFKQ